MPESREKAGKGSSGGPGLAFGSTRRKLLPGRLRFLERSNPARDKQSERPSDAAVDPWHLSAGYGRSRPPQLPPWRCNHEESLAAPERPEPCLWGQRLLPAIGWQ